MASAEDIVKYHNAVLNEKIVPLNIIRQMLGKRTSLVARGSGIGAEALSVLDLDSKISVVILSNTSGLEQQIALDRARNILLTVFK